MQAVLRMTEHMLKCKSNEKVDSALLSELCRLLSHTDADVRKTVVFCLVEVVVGGSTTVGMLEKQFGLN